jgi:hypothetical protein
MGMDQSIQETAMTQVIVQLEPIPASQAEMGEHAAFKQAERFGTSLRAIHPSSGDPALARWFTAQIDNTKAGEFIDTLRQIPEVTAAYVKPRASMP